MAQPKEKKGKKPTRASAAKLKNINFGDTASTKDKDVQGQSLLLRCWASGTLNRVPWGTDWFICRRCWTLNWV